MSKKSFVVMMKENLDKSITELPSVGVKNVPRLAHLGIRTIRDLLWHFPARYDDYTKVVSIADVQPGEKVNIRGEIVRISVRRIFPRRMSIVDAVVQDQTGSLKVVWFNQPYIANTLIEGSLVSLAGKVTDGKRGVYLASPVYEKVASDNAGTAVRELRHTEGLVPVYPETSGITSKYLRFLIKPLLKSLKVSDPLPPAIIKRHGFPVLQNALRTIHFPVDGVDVEKAKERISFDELLFFQLKALRTRRTFNQLPSHAISFQQERIQAFIASLPFLLTHDQKVAAWEILKDLQKSYPMNRLLEGDVGSGKTVVALIAALQTAYHGYQTVFMVPTEVLAIQHADAMKKLLKNTGVSLALLTSAHAYLDGVSMSKIALKKHIQNGSAQIIIGTHAVIQKDVGFKKLALVVIDEQHRFGIEHRSALIRTTRAQSPNNPIPHLLSMTATPIPRTLALTIFGDLDISLIREKPKDRQKIITQVISKKDQSATYAFIEKQIKEGRQVFVICPRIDTAKETEEKDDSTNPLQARVLSQSKLIWAEVKAVEEEYARLSKIVFPNLRIAMLHGKMKAKEKQNIMREFKDGWHDILVSTSVIEVGVDVPNATIMLIESAERFGLAQLHQFRGRVGRSHYQSYCFLFTSDGTPAGRRLQALVSCDDGFELAEKDMRIRGPGEFFGVKQSGVPDFAMASLANMDLIKKARTEARTLLKDDPGLTRYPLLKERLDAFQRMHHFE